MNEAQQVARVCLELIETARPKGEDSAFAFKDRITVAQNFLLSICNGQLEVSQVEQAQAIEAEELQQQAG